MSYKKEKYGMLVVWVWFAAFFVMALQMKDVARPWALFCEGMGIILSSVRIAIVVYKEKHGVAVDGVAPLNREQFKTVLLALAFFVGYCVAAKIIGFIVTTFVFCVTFAFWLFRGDKKWKYIAVAAGLTLFCYLSFIFFLGIPLPKGLLI